MKTLKFHTQHMPYDSDLTQAIEKRRSGTFCVIETEPDIEAAVRKFLITVITYSTASDGSATGCYLASCVSTTIGYVEGVAERMEKAIADTDDRLAGRFEQAVEDGQLRTDFPSRERARLLFDIRQGYAFRGRAGSSAKALMTDLDDRVPADSLDKLEVI